MYYYNSSPGREFLPQGGWEGGGDASPKASNALTSCIDDRCEPSVGGGVFLPEGCFRIELEKVVNPKKKRDTQSFEQKENLPGTP